MAKLKRRKRLHMPEGLDGVLSRAGENRYAKTKPPVSEEVWTQAVGHRIAERARPVGLERGILTVRAATAVWSSELSLLSDALLERLRACGVEVKELRFRVGPLDPPRSLAEVRTSRRIPSPAAITEELAEAIDGIADDELRAIVKGAASANLAWQKK